MKAFLKNYRQAPRKVRLIADSVRKKRVSEAVAELSFRPNKAAAPLKKLILSAFANARQSNPNLKEDELVISHITVDKGFTFTRFMPRAHGRATPINRESSHVRVELGYVDGVAKEAPAEKAAEKKPEKKATEKKTATKKETRKKTDSKKKEAAPASV